MYSMFPYVLEKLIKKNIIFKAEVKDIRSKGNKDNWYKKLLGLDDS